jgi:hypothetical protein
MTNLTWDDCFVNNFAATFDRGVFVMEFAASAPDALERAKTIADPLLI